MGEVAPLGEQSALRWNTGATVEIAMSRGDSAYLRGLLASSGILLDELAIVTEPILRTGPAPVDRDEVRQILVADGAPAGDLEWLVSSCPTLDAARGYRAPARYAWCLECMGEVPCDDEGCINCRRTA
jgi:hypothetical protein